MESTKLSQLLNRFENYVDVAETASALSGDEQLARFEALVIRLEKARGAGGAQAAPVQAAAPSGGAAASGGASFAPLFKANVLKNVEALRAATKEINKE